MTTTDESRVTTKFCACCGVAYQSSAVSKSKLCSKACIGRMRGRDVSARFWMSVTKDESGCWLWTVAANGGYGHLKRAGKRLLAHRVSWEIHNGAIPDGLWVLHRCDNPPCVNPAHLFLGTPGDNVLDCVSKGRARKKGRGVMSDSELAIISAAMERGEGKLKIARALGRTRTAIVAACRDGRVMLRTP